MINNRLWINDSGVLITTRIEAGGIAILFTIEDVEYTVSLAHGRLNYYRDDGEDWSDEDYHAALRTVMEKLLQLTA